MQGFTADDVRGVLTITEIATSARWSIELGKLPVRLSDCESQERCAIGEVCSGVCIRSAQLVGVDSPRRLLYFVVNTGYSRNPPKVLFQYNLATSRARRLSIDDGAWMDSLQVSSNGRYLAYDIGWHSGLTCPPLSTAAVVDLQTGRVAHVKGWVPEGVEESQSVEIRGIQWLGNSRLEVDATVRDAACRNDAPDWNRVGKSKRQVVNPGALTYR